MTGNPLKALASANSKNKPIPIIAITGDLSAWLKKASKEQQAWVKTSGFKAKNGEFLAIPSNKGGVDMVLWAVGSAGLPSDPWSYAKLAESLPDNTYALPANLGKKAFNAAFGWALAHYSFDRFKGEKPNTKAKLKQPNGLDKKRLKALLEATIMVRDLVNLPTSHMQPSHLGAEAKKLAKTHKATIKITTGKKLLDDNFPTIHAVGRASNDAPRLIDMRWGKKSHPKLSLVGKGVCFDSGGLGIKPSDGMRNMKKDMGGAAHVLGLAHAIMALKLPVRLRVLIPAVENSISANAFRPGDIIKTRKGITVEVGHTDAEGRLVLCDALALADEETPDMLLDFATLTGAARVALGPDLPALFCDDKKLVNEFLKAGEDNHDHLWQLPIWQGYADDIKSNIADINNVSDSGFAGATIGALFLDRFVEKSKVWAHFDIFAWNPKPKPGKPKGGEAMALRAVLATVEKTLC